MATNAENKPDIPEADSKTKEQEALGSLGLSDHRVLTTADVPAIAAYIGQTAKASRGPKGPKGDRGPAGPKGDKGEKGASK